jgi:uncharacterized protein
LIVVSDTSPILNLARINRLQLLASLYREIVIPSAVYEELAASTGDLAATADFASSPWIVVATVQDQERVKQLRKILDYGEAEAVILAIERKADLFLVDERCARRTASSEGLAVRGLLGVIGHAKRAGLIDAAKPLLDELIHVARFWIGPALYAEALAAFGEADAK